MIYVTLIMTSFILLHLFVFPYGEFRKWVLHLNIHFIIVNIFFLLAAFKKPGIVKPHGELKFEKLVERLDPNGLCPNCETIYTRDSRHCYICNKCVHKFDHHCNWINNCVGKNNHYVFYTYIVTLLALFITLDSVCFLNIETILEANDLKNTYNILGLHDTTNIFL
mgnify:CR=1 FL=1|jgi:hypothetical protein